MVALSDDNVACRGPCLPTTRRTSVRFGPAYRDASGKTSLLVAALGRKFPLGAPRLPILQRFTCHSELIAPSRRQIFFTSVPRGWWAHPISERPQCGLVPERIPSQVSTDEAFDSNSITPEITAMLAERRTRHAYTSGTAGDVRQHDWTYQNALFAVQDVLVGDAAAFVTLFFVRPDLAHNVRCWSPMHQHRLNYPMFGDAVRSLTVLYRRFIGVFCRWRRGGMTRNTDDLSDW